MKEEFNPNQGEMFKRDLEAERKERSRLRHNKKPRFQEFVFVRKQIEARNEERKKQEKAERMKKMAEEQKK